MTPKFRAWDNGMEMMVYQGDDEIYICFDGEKWKLLDYYGTHWETDEYGMNEIEQPWEVENIEIMQWTGMKDIKGVEIYEGDILKCTSGIYTNLGATGTGEYEETIKQVIWKDDSWGTRVISSNLTSKGAEKSGLVISAKYAEIIGNIYENPELLEDLKNG